MTRIEREKTTVRQMIELYCQRKEKNRALCPECRQLLAYAHKRLDACRYGSQKGVCQQCSTHCYAPARREQIRQIMRYSGPRMLLFHPIAAIRHLFFNR